jgi:hypothetical protein
MSKLPFFFDHSHVITPFLLSLSSIGIGNYELKGVIDIGVWCEGLCNIYAPLAESVKLVLHSFAPHGICLARMRGWGDSIIWCRPSFL